MARTFHTILEAPTSRYKWIVDPKYVESDYETRLHELMRKSIFGNTSWTVTSYGDVIEML